MKSYDSKTRSLKNDHSLALDDLSETKTYKKMSEKQ